MLWAILVLIAALSSILTVVINKMLLQEANELTVVFSYFFFSTILLAPFFILDPTLLNYPQDLLPLAALNGLLNIFSIILYMKAIKIGNISIVVPLRNTTPLFVAVLAIVFLSENVTELVFLGSLLIVIGAATLNHGQSKMDVLPAIYALVVALIAAVVFIIIKYSVTLGNPMPFIFYSTIVSSAAALIIILIKREIYHSIATLESSVPQFFLAGLFATIASLSIVFASTMEKASIVAPFLRVELLFGILAGYIFFKEKLTKKKIIGALLILCGLIMVLL